jgi:oligopeptide/dipeptide ABC transporter ATP-binding protein
MYAGRIIEEGRTAQVFRRPLHPYTRGLLQLVPRSLRDSSLSPSIHLPAIPGGPHNLERLRCGCAFEPRCSERMQVCKSQYPEELAPEEDRRVSCLIYGN